MSSDRSSRNRDRTPRRRQPSDQVGTPQGSGQLQSPRRRTSFVPRHGSGRARSVASNQSDFDDTFAIQQGRGAQRPIYRQTAQGQLSQYDYYEDENDDIVYQDEPPPRRTQPRRSPTYSRQSQGQYDAQTRPSGVRAQSNRPDDDYSDEYGDSFIDEDDWYEEEVAAGAARPRSSRGRRARSAPRTSLSLPRPNISGPIVPRGIREAALVQDQNALILVGSLLVSVLLLALFTSNRVESLEPGFATHISASGLPQSIQSESALWHLPLMGGALLLMSAVLAWFAAQRSRFLSRYFLATAGLVQVLVWVAFLRIAY